ncbi:hypothetical protein [Mycobacterium kyorinense]|uniref:AttH domain-containing protein n=1 Tax=Mycobacterium kyorinense TaxID=487514 RepID=A0A1X1XQS7_9MYCO|nr:hypothetical protein [Mycobacterium kyorinense]ORW01202.1 hypothetical protein AWC14_08775 [Mycobacterium kyorinense]
MLERIDFEVTRHTPSLDHYRREWVPGKAMNLAGIWVGAIVRDASGQDYWAVRGTDDFITGMTHVVSPICGFRKLQKGMNTDAPHLFDEYSTLDWFEPLQYGSDGERVQMTYWSGRIERDANGFHWYDASGRWEIHAKTISDIVVTRVPKQDGVDNDVYYRHELMYATGRVNGVEVSGYAHQDFAYGPPGMAYTELSIARHLQGMWVSWLHEFADGEVGGGSFWQGRDAVTFGPGYQVKDGVTTVHKDIVAKPEFNDAGRLVNLDVTIGSESYTFAFDSSGSPLHVFGPLTSSSSGKEPVRSWCWVEYAGGMLTPEILDMAMEPFRLARGR